MGPAHFPPLDGLRGIAVLMVIIGHSFHYNGSSIVGRALETVARGGWVGVTLFFVLSGFLITGILLDTQHQKHYLRDFYARRSLRIFPLYFTFLALFFFVVPQVPILNSHLSQPRAEIRIYYWTYLTNMREWLSGIPWHEMNGAPLGGLWSLAVEEQVYLFWPFLILLAPRRSLIPILIGMMVASFAWRFVTRLTGQSMEFSYSWAPANLEAFAGGAIVSWLSRNNLHLLGLWAPRVTALSAAFVLGMFAGQRGFDFSVSPVQILTVGTTGLVLLFSGTIACLVTSSQDSIIGRALSASWLGSIGKYSYAMYMFHPAIIAILAPALFIDHENINSRQDLWDEVVFSVGVGVSSYLAALVSWNLLEKHFLSLKRYFPLSGEVRLISSPLPPDHAQSLKDAKCVGPINSRAAEIPEDIDGPASG